MSETIEQIDRARARVQSMSMPTMDQIARAVSEELDRAVLCPEKIGNAVLRLYEEGGDGWQRFCALMAVAMMEPRGDAIGDMRTLMRQAMVDDVTDEVMRDMGALP